MARRSRKKAGVKVDFSGVESGGKVRAGDHLCRVDKCTVEEGDAAKYLAWEFVPQKPKVGGRLYYNTSLAPQALWNLKGVLESLGVDVPDGEMDLTPDEYIGLECGITVEMGTWNNKPRPECVDFYSADDFGSEGGDDEEDEDEGDEEQEELTADEIMQMDADELEDVVDDLGLDVDLDKIRGIKKKRQAVVDAMASDEGDEEDEEDEDDEGDEGDEDEGYDADEVNAMSSAELASLVKEEKLKVTLEGTTRKKRRAVVNALKAKGLLIS